MVGTNGLRQDKFMTYPVSLLLQKYGTQVRIGWQPSLTRIRKEFALDVVLLTVMT